jgi:hypothetical protein
MLFDQVHAHVNCLQDLSIAAVDAVADGAGEPERKRWTRGVYARLRAGCPGAQRAPHACSDDVTAALVDVLTPRLLRDGERADVEEQTLRTLSNAACQRASFLR